jgi:hypothetical protein
MIGYRAGKVQLGHSTISIGYEAALNARGGGMIAIGRDAARGVGQHTAGGVAIGYQAGNYIMSGSTDSVTLVGYRAGFQMSGSNTFVGHNSGYGSVSSAPYGSGEHNTALGHNTLYSLSTGNYNVAIGHEAGKAMTTGDANTSVGYEALRDQATSANNTAIGTNALSNSEAADNTAVGKSAGDTIISGAENTLLGCNVDVASEDNNNNVVIGNNLTATDKNNAVFIGNNTNHIENDFNADATWNYSSDVRQKTNIEDDTLGLDFINKIRPVVYKHKSPSEFPKEWSSYDADDKEPMGGDKRIHGLIAQEVKETLDNQGIDTFGGWSEGDDGRQRVSREMFVTPLIKAVQELSSENKELKDELNELKTLIKEKLGD